MTKNEFCEVVLQAIKPAEKLISMVPADKLVQMPFLSARSMVACNRTLPIPCPRWGAPT
jgi:hypothetical protein